MRGRRVLVTGASGFIGAALVRRLLTDGAAVCAIVRPASNLARLVDVLDAVALSRADLTDDEAVARVVRASRATHIVHLAVHSGHPTTSATRREALRVSVLGTAALLEAAVQVGVERFVHMGSSLEYARAQRPLRERDPLRPDTARGLTKALGTQLAQYWARAHGLHTVVVRPFSVYGPGESAKRFIPTVVRAALHGTVLPMTKAPAVHDWIFVEDVVDLTVKLLDADVPPGEAFNAGTGRQWRNDEVVALVEELTGRRIRVARGAYPGSVADRPHWVADMSKTREQVGWSPRWDLRAGLEATIRWWAAQEAMFERDARV